MNRRLLADAEQRDALHCIRCGACLNVCPIYRNIGGHSYATTYQGPIGSVITPHLRGLMDWKHLSYASSLCGACTETCPVKIDLHHHLLHNRRNAMASLIVGAYHTAGQSDHVGALPSQDVAEEQLGVGNVDYSPDGAGVDVHRYGAVLMVAAENPYAEMLGDIIFPAPMGHSRRYPEDLKALERVSGKGVPVVTVLFSGRPVPANDLINRSDAFVAAWLPGTEALGLTDLLLARGGDRKGEANVHAA